MRRPADKELGDTQEEPEVEPSADGTLPVDEEEELSPLGLCGEGRESFTRHTHQRSALLSPLYEASRWDRSSARCKGAELKCARALPTSEEWRWEAARVPSEKTLPERGIWEA